MAKKTEALAWSTVKRKVSDLVPYGKNPRIMSEKQAEKLKDSLLKFNLVEIPAINLDNTVIAGHMRLKIMTLIGRGEEEIDVRIPNRQLTDAEFQEYNIRSNKNSGMFDKDILANEFEEAELINWGFEPYEFGKIPDKPLTHKEKRYSFTYEVIFNTEIEKDEFKDFLNNLKSKYPDLETEGDRIIRYTQEHGI